MLTALVVSDLGLGTIQSQVSPLWEALSPYPKVDLIIIDPAGLDYQTYSKEEVEFCRWLLCREGRTYWVVGPHSAKTVGLIEGTNFTLCHYHCASAQGRTIWYAPAQQFDAQLGLLGPLRNLYNHQRALAGSVPVYRDSNYYTKQRSRIASYYQRWLERQQIDSAVVGAYGKSEVSHPVNFVGSWCRHRQALALVDGEFQSCSWPN